MTITKSLLQFSSTLAARAGAIETVEQVRQGVVMPLLASLGYDVFDPEGLVSDYSVSAERKKSERADHAVMVGGRAAILIKVRAGNGALENKALASLATEFSLGSADFVVLVNARYIQIYSDLDQAGVIDLSPFMSLDLHDIKLDDAQFLAAFAKEGFDGEAIRAKVDQVKFGPILVERLQDLLNKPTPAFVSMLLAGAVSGVPGDQLLDRCGQYLRSGYRKLVSDEVRARIARALDDTPPEAAEPAADTAPGAASVDKDGSEDSAEELLGLQIIRAIAFGLADSNDIVLRANQTYAAILYKDNNRRTVARLHMKRSSWYIGLLDNEQRETRHPISSVENIFAFAEQIRAAVTRHAEAPLTELPKRVDTKAHVAGEQQSESTQVSLAQGKPQLVPAATPEAANPSADALAPVAQPEPSAEAIVDSTETPTSSDAAEPAVELEKADGDAATALGDDVGPTGNAADVQPEDVQPIMSADGAPELSLEDFDKIFDEISGDLAGQPAGGDTEPSNEVLEELINSPISGPEGGSLSQTVG